MIVTKHNFPEAKEKFMELVKRASFASLDLELSGIDYDLTQDQLQRKKCETIQGKEV